MKLVVFGADSPTGHLVTAMAAAEGHTVTAITRRPADFPFYDRGVQVADADLMDADAVDWVMWGHDAVISVIGAPPSRRPGTVHSQGVYNIVKAMVHHGLRRLVCVSHAGLDAVDEPRRARLRRGAALLTGRRAAHQDVRRMESVVQESGLDWTLVRPGRLVSRSGVTDYRIATHAAPRPVTSRADLAHALVREATARDHVRETVYVTTGHLLAAG
ncbi:NAD(P)-dependent oxidoreductase [Streptomyces sp. F001]|uniref:NAD(P)-dependent oxidoreductase n=1 Tax=Streptomyces sp. F001 TaxID=1510026 RepID=UPI00101E37A9|nr:NAD(P)H-binding protein [Streptomyces sp. F001]RZB16705.1 NAD-dependent epimerase/dehydratase family protein [Streptomyces sp. F001]